MIREECAAVPGIILKSEQRAKEKGGEVRGGGALQWIPIITIAMTPFSSTPFSMYITNNAYWDYAFYECYIYIVIY